MSKYLSDIEFYLSSHYGVEELPLCHVVAAVKDAITSYVTLEPWTKYSHCIPRFLQVPEYRFQLLPLYHDFTNKRIYKVRADSQLTKAH